MGTPRGLVLLVSAQAVPNLQALLTLRPDKAWILVTPEMAGRHDRWLIRAIAAAGAAPPAGIVPVKVMAAHLPGPTAEVLQKVFALNEGWSWDIVLSGGTKPMAIGAWLAGKDVGARFLYMEIGRPSELVDLETGDVLRVRAPLSLEVFLAGHGFHREDEEARTWSKKEVALARNIARHARQPLLADAGPPMRLSPGLPRDLRDLLLRRTRDPRDGTIAERWRPFLSGGWLEAFLWAELSRVGEAIGLRDVTTGLRLVEESGDLRNEIDVAAMHFTGLLAIEAKTGHRVTDGMVYKFSTVLHQLRALGVRGILVLGGAGTEAVTTALRKRARFHGIRLLDGRDIEIMARNGDPRTVAGVLGLPGETG